MRPIIDSLFGIFATIALGNILRHTGFTSQEFYDISDRLVYYVFFPVMLFWQLGSPSPSAIEWHLGIAALLAVSTLCVASIVYAKIFRLPDFAVGSFSQGCYRFNTYIGLPVVLNAFGNEGVRHFGIIIGTAIPVINILAVFTLIWFSGSGHPPAVKGRLVLRALLLNPLILACFLGLLYSKTGAPFPAFLDNAFRLLSSTTLPLALLSIGSSLSLSVLKGHFRLALTSSLFKLVLLPAAGWGFMRLLGISGMPFRIGMIYFALPTSTANYILSSQLDSDVDLASAGTVLSTLLSMISIPVALLLFGK